MIDSIKRNQDYISYLKELKDAYTAIDKARMLLLDIINVDNTLEEIVILHDKIEKKVKEADL